MWQRLRPMSIFSAGDKGGHVIGYDTLTHMNNRRSMQEMMRQLTSDGERQVAFPKG